MSKYDSAGLAMIPSGYKASKVYSLIPNSSDGDFDFARSSSATRVNKDGLIETVATNVPRLDYPLIDGVVQDTPSLLLEPSRRNLFLYSDDFSLLTSVNGASASNTSLTTAPDGSSNADLLVAGASGSVQGIYRPFTLSSAVTYTASVFAKAKEVSVLQLQGGGAGWGSNTYANFDLENGAFQEGSGIISGSAFIKKLPNGWYLCGFSATTTGTSANISFDLVNSLSDVRDATFSGSSGDGLYLWGAQLEDAGAGVSASYATSYIPTSGSTVTRAAETCNGAGTSADFNDSEGVLFVESAALADDGANRQMTIYGTGGNSVRLYYHTTSNTIRLLIQGGGTTKVDETYTTGDITLFHKIAGKYKDGDTALWINGFEVETSNATLSISGLSSLNLETSSGGSNVFLSKTKQVIAFKEILTDAELEDLTSWDTFNEMATQQLYTIE